MSHDFERFGYDDACAARDFIDGKLRERGLSFEDVKDGIILGSGLGGFAKTHLNRDRVNHDDGPIVVPFQAMFEAIGIPAGGGPAVQGHARELVIGPLHCKDGKRLVIAQSGREHPYEGVSLRRATFWLRVMQVLGVETLFGSNAAGVVTPHTLGVPSLMLVSADIDEAGDNPLYGPNDERLGRRFQHMNDKYPEASRDLVKAVAARVGIELREGLLFREMGPSYESPETILRLRGVLREIWRQRFDQPGENRFQTDDPTGMVGMSSTFEHAVAQHAAYSEKNPAFQRGRAHVSVATNYAAGMGPDGFVPPPTHDEVKERAAIVEEQFGRLAEESILEMGKAA